MSLNPSAATFVPGPSAPSKRSDDFPRWFQPFLTYDYRSGKRKVVLSDFDTEDETWFDWISVLGTTRNLKCKCTVSQRACTCSAAEEKAPSVTGSIAELYNEGKEKRLDHKLERYLEEKPKKAERKMRRLERYRDRPNNAPGPTQIRTELPPWFYRALHRDMALQVQNKWYEDGSPDIFDEDLSELEDEDSELESEDPYECLCDFEAEECDCHAREDSHERELREDEEREYSHNGSFKTCYYEIRS